MRFFRQWLAERNLELVPIAEPASFDWAGQWIAVVERPDGLHAVVMFGSSSGVWLDPARAHEDGAKIKAGWTLTPLDLHLPTQMPCGRSAGVGAARLHPRRPDRRGDRRETSVWRDVSAPVSVRLSVGGRP